MSIFEVTLADETATVAFGAQLAQIMTALDQNPALDEAGNNHPSVIAIYLHGELGAGKTTLTRGIVTGFGHQGRVKSPTYTLVEPYELASRCVYHFDLYRLADPEELEYMGIRDYFSGGAVCVIEWPQRGQGFLPAADIAINLVYVEQHRRVKVVGLTPYGDKIVSRLVKGSTDFSQ